MSLPPLDRLDALLLDLDDTILDNRSGDRGAWHAVVALVRGRQPELPASELMAAIAAQTEWFWSDPERERRGRLDIPAARRDIFGVVLKDLGQLDPELCEEAARVYAEHREASYRLFDGARAALGRLRAALPRMAIVTNGAALPQRQKLERFGLEGFFDHIQVEGEFGLGKPEPAVFHHVAERLEAAPGRCLMVGDDYRCDVLGALGSGVHAAWVDAGRAGAPPSVSPRPHARVRSLVELTGLLLGEPVQGAEPPQDR